MAIGNSIIISRGLLNLVPDDSVLAVLLARQIAHIVLDDPDPFTLRWPESLFAFSKKQDFPGLGIRHTPKQEESADQEALLLIKGSRYEHAVPETKVFLSQLSAESRRFRNLVRPRFGIAVTPRGCGLVDHHVRKTPATSTGFQLRDTYGVSWAGAVIEHESARVQAGSGNGQQNLPRTAASAR